MVFNYGEHFTLTERCNKRKLAYLIHNYDAIDWKSSKQPDLKTMKTYFYRLNSEGEADVQFEQKNGQGRYFAKGPSLSTMPSSVRNIICDEHKDMDIVNCGPTMLLAYFKQFPMSGPYAPPEIRYIPNYVQNREEYLNDAMEFGLADTRAKAKELMIRALYSGKIDTKYITSLPQWVKSIPEEVQSVSSFIERISDKSLRSKLQKRYDQDIKDGKKSAAHASIEGMFISYVIQQMETKYIIGMMECLRSNGIEIISYSYDGFMVSSAHSKDTIMAAVDACPSIHSEANFEGVKLIEKPIEPLLTPTNEMMSNISSNGTVSIFNNGIYDSNRLFDRSQTFEELKSVFDQICFKITYKGIFVLINSYDESELIKIPDLRNTFIDMQYYDPNSKNIEDPYMSFIDKWIRDSRHVRYDKVSFDPTGDRKGMYNLWRGFTYDHLEPSKNIESIDYVLGYIEKLFKTDSEREYILNWISALIQFPGDKPEGAALVLYSYAEGSGKNCLCDIIANLIGREYAFFTSSPENDLWGSFNGSRKYKLLTVLDEANPIQNHKAADKIKSMITDKEMNINEKFVNMDRMCDYSRFIFTTNSPNSVSINSADRRLVPFEVSDCLSHAVMGKEKARAYFNVFYRDIFTDRQKMADIFHYFKNRPITIDIVKDRPETNLRKTLIEVNTPLINRWLGDFIHELINGQDIVSQAAEAETGEIIRLYKSSDLYKMYVHYAEQNGVPSKGITKHSLTKQLNLFVMTNEFNTAIPGFDSKKINNATHYVIDAKKMEETTKQWVS